MKNNTTLKYIIKIAALAAISAIIMLFEFPLWFAPGFYKLDLSEAVILMGSFALGPVAGVLIELLKNLLNIILNGTTTAYVGEFANFVTGCAFVLPAAFIYKYKKNIKAAISGMIASTFSLAIIGGLLNYYVMIPAFSSLYKLPIDAIIDMAKALNPWVVDLKTMIVFAVAPFNLVKGVLCSILAMLIYKRISGILHK
ncbi:MAG: ECF transporter S component [Ruminococcaceae bacterium]|nr:ECF transporter S component [Oscillospiraceae bacterium]